MADSKLDREFLRTVLSLAAKPEVDRLVLSALLEIDLRRAAEECALRSVDVLYSQAGRVPLTSLHYPAALASWFPRALSDNLLLIGRKPTAGGGTDRP